MHDITLNVYKATANVSEIPSSSMSSFVFKLCVNQIPYVARCFYSVILCVCVREIERCVCECGCLSVCVCV